VSERKQVVSCYNRHNSPQSTVNWKQGNNPRFMKIEKCADKNIMIPFLFWCMTSWCYAEFGMFHFIVEIPFSNLKKDHFFFSLSPQILLLRSPTVSDHTLCLYVTPSKAVLWKPQGSVVSSLLIWFSVWESAVSHRFYQWAVVSKPG